MAGCLCMAGVEVTEEMVEAVDGPHVVLCLWMGPWPLKLNAAMCHRAPAMFSSREPQHPLWSSAS